MTGVTATPAEPAAERDGLRSYKTRKGRLGPTGARALAELWPRWGCAPDALPADPAALFGRRARLALEIGSGLGEATAAMAAADAGTDLLAVEVHTPGVAALLRRIDEAGLSNVRVVEADAVALLRGPLAGWFFDEVRVFFPDPWPKSRHHKRRLVSEAFADLVAARLRSGGVLHVATDWHPYAESALGVLDAHHAFVVTGLEPRPAHRPLTRFEGRGHGAGRASYDLVAVRRPA